MNISHERDTLCLAGNGKWVLFFPASFSNYRLLLSLAAIVWYKYVISYLNLIFFHCFDRIKLQECKVKAGD